MSMLINGHSFIVPEILEAYFCEEFELWQEPYQLITPMKLCYIKTADYLDKPIFCYVLHNKTRTD